jgi:peptidoglycan/xylan/chitin deacetylase (PgdA/CDA1 family)
VRAILTYHSIDPSGSPISLDEETFRRHVAWLGSGAVPVVSIDALLALPDEADALALTFDDGFENVASRAWPLLREHRLPALLFVPSDRVGADNAWSGRAEPGIPTLPLLSWDALARLCSEGLRLGSHSASHRHLESVRPDELPPEVAGSAARIEQRTGARPEVFCYPFGTHDDRVVAQVRESYRFACTTELATLKENSDPHLLPRLDAYYYRRPGSLERFGSGAFRAHLWLRAGARRLRAALAR